MDTSRIMKSARWAMVFLALFTGWSASAGSGWVSSGGELFKDAHNPWFVRNTKKVTYCVQVAETSFSTPVSDAQALVERALKYWQNEFAKSEVKEDGHFSIGTQTFEEVACAQNPDIRFLLGYETLSQEQIEYLREPTKYIGIAVRTEYDPVQLKGRGFIYISSDFGPRSYDNPGDTLISRAWQRQRLLEYALLHEIGHVFGLSHAGTGLMAEAFLEQMLNKNFAEVFEKLPIPSFFQPDSELRTCEFIMASTRSWFGMDSNLKCISMKRTGMNALDVFGFVDERDTQGKKLGTLIVGSSVLLDFQPQPAVILQITDKQAVFSPQETLFRSFMFGPMFIDMGATANFVSGPGQVKPAYMRFTPTSLKVNAVSGSKVDLVFSYTSPLGVMLLRKPTP